MRFEWNGRTRTTRDRMPTPDRSLTKAVVYRAWELGATAGGAAGVAAGVTAGVAAGVGVGVVPRVTAGAAALLAAGAGRATDNRVWRNVVNLAVTARMPWIRTPFVSVLIARPLPR
jgi:hypothetical protein